MPARPSENELPLPPPLRAYTLISTSGSSPRNLSIISESSNSEIYTISIERTIEKELDCSIMMCSPSSRQPIIGIVRMEGDCDTFDMALGSSEEFSRHESCVREYMYVGHDLNTTTHEFSVGLGDEMRRHFVWHPDEVKHNWYTTLFRGGGHSWDISKLLHSLPGMHGNATEKKNGSATTVHDEQGRHLRRRCYKLIDRNAGEIVAIFMCHMDLVHGEIVNSDDTDIDIEGKFVIFRDFWESGKYEERWDKVVLLSGVTVLERADWG
ncbi:hypothetical protein OIDMADRAFT_56513 [Oidiodendron maius Zn]|uniref:Uncharacterized protein n=1 Tax=Oidiodendron maius (strain Zn) TaxID=913774 RepID=A0A0C3HAJ1_OIDMZ|nr:hypothetical protein OIDMADRAFT_56513 [Oidiodendron maius Zn]